MNLGEHKGRTARTLGMVALSGLIALTACDDEKKSDIAGSQVALTGRVFLADTGKPQSMVTVAFPGDKSATSGQDGTFAATYASSKNGVIQGKSKSTASVQKPAPERSSHVELYVKGYDAQKQLNAADGGPVVAASGAKVEVPAGTLKTKDGQKPTNARVSIAAPDPRKPTALSSIPGNFDAKTKGGQKGKLSAESPMYVVAQDGDKPLELEAGTKTKVNLPSHAQGAGNKAGALTLFRYDEATGQWVEAGSVTRVQNAQGLPVYEGEITELGWWAVGEFYDQLSCVRGCVKDASGEAAAGSRVVVSGVDHFSQITGYAGEDGCFALDVRAGAQVRVVAQTQDGLAGPLLVTTSEEAASATEPDQCQSVGELRLVTQEQTDCPLGLTECGEACVDLAFDPANCGECGSACEQGVCLEGQCRRPMAGGGTVEPETDAGRPRDGQDGGTSTACSCPPVETGAGVRDGCCLGTSCGFRVEDLPFSVESFDGCAFPLPVRSPEQCPSVFGPSEIMFGGCCLETGVCGAATNQVTMSRSEPLDYGLGCQPLASLGLEAQPTTCGSQVSPDAGPSDGTPDAGVIVEPVPDASVDPAPSDASTGADEGLACSDGPCSDYQTDYGTLNACCSTDKLCGSEPDELLIEYGFTRGSCIERKQPFTTGECPSTEREGSFGLLTLPGCCRLDGLCGYDTANVFINDKPNDFGTGCISYEDAGEVGDAAVAPPCGQAPPSF